MSRCRGCGKSIKWLEVPEDTPAGTMLRWKSFDARRPRGEPYRPHACKAPKPKPFPKNRPKPWWDRD